MTEFADGLQLSRLQPSSIIVFLQGLTRRVDERRIDAVVSEHDTAPTEIVTEVLRSIHDLLARAAVALKEAGFAPDHDVQDHAQPAVLADPELSRLNAAALEVARRVAGVPDSGWTQMPELLDLVRNCCAEVAHHVQSIGDPPEAAVDNESL